MSFIPSGKFKTKVWKQDSGDRAAWLDSIDDIPEDTTKKSEFSSGSSISRRSTSRCSGRSAERRNRIRHQQSGERAWWMSDDPSDVPEGVEVISVAPSSTGIQLTVTTSIDDTDSHGERENLARSLNRIRHVESGEKAWWMKSNSNIPEGIEKITPDIESNSNSDSSESFEKLEIRSNDQSSSMLNSEIPRGVSRFPIEFAATLESSAVGMDIEEPLGERASPEGVGFSHINYFL